MLSVTIVTDIGETFPLQVDPNSTVGNLKTDLVALARCSTESMILTHDSQTLRDIDSIQASNIPQGARIQLFVRMPAEFEVFVCPPTGELLRFTLSPKDTTEDLWAKVRDAIEVGPSMQLLYNGKKLQPGELIQSLQLGPSPQFVLWPVPPI